jgi:hypothetical protein
MRSYLNFGRSPMQKYIALTLGLLMVAIGCVQAVHVHDALARQSSPASHCSFCVVAHNAAVITPFSSAPMPLVEASLPALSQPQLTSRLLINSSFIRPPPQSL